MLQQEGRSLAAGTPLYQLPLLNHHANGHQQPMGSQAYPDTSPQFQPPLNHNAYPDTTHHFQPPSNAHVHSSAGYRVGPPSLSGSIVHDVDVAAAAEFAQGDVQVAAAHESVADIDFDYDYDAEGQVDQADQAEALGGGGLLGADYGDTDSD
jgi:hypothetical protein